MRRNEKLARAWVALRQNNPESKEYQENFWAVEAFALIVEDNPSLFFELVELILQLDSSDLLVANLGAGPLEDLLVYHGDRYITEVVQKIHADGNWKRVAQNVWQNAMNDRVWQQLQVAIK